MKSITLTQPQARALAETGELVLFDVFKEQPPDECNINYTLGNESWLPVAERSPLRRVWEAWGRNESKPASRDSCQMAKRQSLPQCFASWRI